MYTQYTEEYQKQLSEIPQRLYYTWLSSLPSLLNAFKVSDNMEKTLELQHEVIKNYLAAQEIAVNTALSAQKQWWDTYFDVMKKASSAKVEVGI
ncbi:conserved hypothetical protein [Gloeothece citriformis PCC 7424]|uniref:Phasin family protein n=1 Tax=Gloeothece citriformis (strain PCC 7424) TaxID=65393 RepID=B7KEC9_GLOC7|nr:hypothetical protein [Gloeothece citriformis]ACK73247.1 conserved hypothetical protein [Gloeothece citriformis PCC 7424]